jgi:hypothetical protein
MLRPGKKRRRRPSRPRRRRKRPPTSPGAKLPSSRSARCLAQARSAWEADRPAEALRYSQEALAIEAGNAEAAELLKSADARIAERAITALVALYDKALADNNLPSFYSANCTASLASEVLKDAEMVSRLFVRFRSTVAAARIVRTGPDAADVSFDHKLVGISKEAGAEQVLFQGTMRWRVERRGDRWIIAGIASEPGPAPGSSPHAGGGRI